MKGNDQIVKKGKVKKSYCDATMLLIVLSVITFFGLSFCLWFTSFYNDQLLKLLIIKKGSYLFKSWVRPPVSPLVCVHAFNYTNTVPFLKGYTNEVIVQDVGPYCYRETTEKVQVQFHNNGTVSYRDNRTHQFAPEMSRGSLNDTLVIPNIPYFAAVAMARNMNYFARATVVGLLVQMDEVFSTVKAQDAFFGYKNTLMTLGNTIAALTNRQVTHDKFGLLLSRSGVSRDLLTVYTGEDDPESSGQVYSVNGERQMKAWTSSECNAVVGGDGSRFPPAKVGAKAPVSIFGRDSCRPLPLVFHSEAKFQEEIPTHRYTVDPDYFKSRTFRNESCYCTAATDCTHDGVFDISACAEGGAPILISQPHFLNGDTLLSTQVLGLQPDQKKHDFFLDIHPKYGLTLGTVSRIQINIEVKKPERTFVLPHVQDGLILPVMWMEISSKDMPQHMLNLMYHATFSVHYFEVILQWTCLSFFTIASICFIRRSRNYFMR